MAAVAAAAVPAWETARKKRSFQQFIKLKCVKNGAKKLNADAVDFDITLLDVRKMKSHILDCVAALGIVQQELVSQEQALVQREGGQPLSKETQAVLLSNKLFKASLSITATAMLHDSIEVPKQSSSIVRLLGVFPDDSKQTDGRGWLPLHWAVVADKEIVTQDDVKLVCTSDPMALQRHHSHGEESYGYTPAHLLCMQEMTQRNMCLIKHFSICNSEAFTMSADYSNRGDPLLYGFSALHIACRYGQPTEELLQHLLQLDSSQIRKRCDKLGGTPLVYLCQSDSCSDRLIGCLLEVDSSAEVVGSGIAGCLESTDYSRMLETVDMLLKANPEAAKHRDRYGCNLLHWAAGQRKLPIQLCIDFIQRILAIHKDAVREVDKESWLPVHVAARHSTVEVMEFLLGLYPESASIFTTDRLSNLLHLAVYDKVNTTSLIEAKVRFLCTRYPAMMLQSNSSGGTPLLNAIYFKYIPVVQILCEAGGQEQVRAPVAHPTKANNKYNGWLPLHVLFYKQAESLRGSHLSKEADYFRMLLRSYPDAAGIEGGIGAGYKKTPYQLAVDNNLPPYYLRLLLRAAPNLNPAELHRLNYAERRMAMFLAFRARTSNIDPPLLARLRFAKMDLVKHVMSFL